MLKLRFSPKLEVILYVEAYYRYKRLMRNTQDAWLYGEQLDLLWVKNKERFARLEANWQANN